MKPVKSIATVVSVLNFIFLVVQFNAAANRRSVATEPALRGQAASKPQAGDFTAVLEGTIGKHEIEMTLLRHGEDISGSYFYENVGIDIEVSGKVDARGNVTLQETDADGKTTGLFKGRLDSRPAAGETLIQLAGTWSKPDGSTSLPFSLSQQHFDLGPGLKIVSKKMAKESEKPKYSIDVEYPQIEGSSSTGPAGFNRAVESFVSHGVAEFKKDSGGDVADQSDEGSDFEVGYEVTFANQQIISVLFSISTYSAGAAHPNSFSKSMNYDLVSGKPLILGNLFKSGSQYLSVLSRICIASLKKRLGPDSDADWINRGASPESNNYSAWNVTGRSLVINFDPYQVASYAEGGQTLRIQYSALRDIIDWNGPLKPLLK